jgi:hypothetical protein
MNSNDRKEKEIKLRRKKKNKIKDRVKKFRRLASTDYVGSRSFFFFFGDLTLHFLYMDIPLLFFLSSFLGLLLAFRPASLPHQIEVNHC